MLSESCPAGVILQRTPNRQHRYGFDQMEMATLGELCGNDALSFPSNWGRLSDRPA
ncbi:NAD-dependent epimerase/dehydratase family protein [Candidatus Pelagisphaera phototrophica]|nr:NAD-dependent epimerase/dehydratase family protein [Candidatus Pelagisphaera phototrophica]